ncbi:chemotaxis protein CheA [Blastopirellula marina]|uniref:Chemotaxis protein CheA n=1 Tax=Blastopirellula marina TaxID=124 RepID=A0A2S8G0N8_9BACT|nr:chemotaxis protein CheA [Blastopirellula marina]PQO38012.1 hypothetical protein C5Y98_07955 [Blastopirellula marina]PTL44668.1 chemotaxis protein CheA [Blastopirellula marina]
MNKKSLDHYRELFLEESQEHLADAEAGLLDLEKTPEDAELLNRIFRDVHSIKGGADTFGFAAIAEFSHSLEAVLERMRNGSIENTGSLAELMFEAIDCLQCLIGAAKTHEVAPANVHEIRLRLNSRVEGNGLSAAGPAVSGNTPGSELTEWFIHFTPGPTTFQIGLDPSLVLRELDSLGELSLQLDTTSLPGLETLEPTQSYLGWQGTLKTSRSLSEIEEVFIFVADGTKVEILREEDRQQRAAVHETKVPQDEVAPCVDVETLHQQRELIPDFLTEFGEHIQVAESNLLELESDPGNADRLNAIYRSFHTIKGNSTFFGLTDIARLAHTAEEMLDQARDGQLQLAGRAFDLTLASVDNLKRLATLVPEFLECTEVPPQDSLVDRLIDALRATLAGNERERSEALAEILFDPVLPSPEPNSPEISQESPKPKQAHRDLKETVRVDRDRLDRLIDIVGELVIKKAAVQEDIRNLIRGEDLETLQQLSYTINDLQELSLSLRMVPVGPTFQKMNRIVRDVARKLKKNIQFEMEGEDTELDKTMVDQLGDPLMHMARNSADHGIESPQQRIEAGKPPVGTIIMRAFLRNGNFFIELQDDGAGLNREVILRKAVERKLISENAAESMADQDVWGLIFNPGFSTATEVTDVSGRGVGMDVVKRNIEALNGSIRIESVAGEGTTFQIRLPLTMAIVEGLSIQLNSATYILPMVSVIESLQPRPGEVKTIQNRGEVIRVRDTVVPLLRLHRIFNQPALHTDPSEGLVVIIEHLGKKLAVLVDDLTDQVQVVMKSLETNYQKVDGIAGATILGSGDVAFILDVAGLMRMHSQTEWSNCNSLTA